MGWHPFRDAKTRVEWRELLLLKQRSLCAICGHRFAKESEPNPSVRAQFVATFDHVVPRSQGGQDELANLRLVHAGCNRARGDGSGSNATPAVPKSLRSSVASK